MTNNIKFSCLKATLVLSVVCLLFSCVPIQKYNDLMDRELKSSEELAKYRKQKDQFESASKDCDSRSKVLNKKYKSLKKDNEALRYEMKEDLIKIDKLKSQVATLENSFSKLRNMEAKEVAQFQSELEAKNLELQKKEDELMALEKQLREKERLLIIREQRVKELEELLRNRENAIQALKDKISAALRAYEDSGLTVEERNGKIYISMQAKLLFKSGSTNIEASGKKAIIDLSNVIQKESDWEVVVEGHTDTDVLNSSSHPTSNWELSVLRSTAVVDVMLSNSELSPKQVMAAGRGEFHPIDKNNKAKNRRIEVIISPNLNELFEIISN